MLAQSNEAKERAPGEKPVSVFASRFQEFQNSRASGTLRHAEILFLKTLVHPGLFYGIENVFFSRILIYKKIGSQNIYLKLSISEGGLYETT